MRRIWRVLLLGLALWLGGAAAALAADPVPAGAAAPREVLVLLRLPPGHFHANSDYGDAYGDQVGRGARRRIAERLAREQGLTVVTDWPMPVLGVDCYVMRVPGDRPVADVVAVLGRDKRVAWAEPMNQFHAQGTISYNDPLYAAQPSARAWRLSDLHQISTGRDVRVAVIDSMVDARHPDLIGQVQFSQNFSPEHGDAPETHGTGVAGIIAARGSNGVGIVGIAPQSRLMALRACWQLPAPAAGSGTVCDTLSLAKALDFAIAHNAQIINMSLAGPDDPLLGKLIDIAQQRGANVVGAFDRTLPGGGFPASHRGVFAATDDSTGLNPSVVYLAPGRGVPTTEPGGHWFLVNGSSYAAAHISGLLALLEERRPRQAGGFTLVFAHDGSVDACATLVRQATPCSCDCAHPLALTALAGQ